MPVLAVELYYVFGPMLAVWAVVLAFIGIRRPDFPRDRGVERIVIGLTGALMLGVILSATIGAETEESEHSKGAEGPAQHTGGGEAQQAPAEPEK